jgi:hypothetical protein
VGLVARALEAAGVVTTSVSAARDITSAARMPRAVFVDFPLGHTTGRVGEPGLSIGIVRAALELVESDDPEQLVDLPHRWDSTDDWKDVVFRPVDDPETGEERYLDERTERSASHRYQSAADESAAAESHRGLSCAVCAGIDY